jgi:hypothetical protein
MIDRYSNIVVWKIGIYNLLHGRSLLVLSGNTFRVSWQFYTWFWAVAIRRWYKISWCGCRRIYSTITINSWSEKLGWYFPCLSFLVLACWVRCTSIRRIVLRELPMLLICYLWHLCLLFLGWFFSIITRWTTFSSWYWCWWRALWWVGFTTCYYLMKICLNILVRVKRIWCLLLSRDLRISLLGWWIWWSG